MRNAAQVRDDGLDAVAFAFNFGLEQLHLVAIEGVFDILKAGISTASCEASKTNSVPCGY